MKKILFLCLAATALLWAPSCSDGEEPKPKVRTSVGMTVTGIEANGAVVTATLESGKAVSAKVIEFYPVSDLTFDYTTEVKLVKFVEDHGVEVSLPYTKSLERLRSGREFISAVIAYNAEGRACCSAYQVWTSVGGGFIWSDDNSAGDLEDNEW